MAVGFAVLIAADVVLAVAPNLWVVFLGIGLWGLHMGLTQGLLAKLVTASAPDALRGSAFGIFYLVSGIAVLVGNALAGTLWDIAGPAVMFWAGAGLTVAGLLGIGMAARNHAAMPEDA
jgi:MFS family permease